MGEIERLRNKFRKLKAFVNKGLKVNFWIGKMMANSGIKKWFVYR